MNNRVVRLIAIGFVMIAAVFGTAALTAIPASAGGDPPNCPDCTTVDLGVPCLTQNGGGTVHRTTCYTLELGQCIPHVTYSCS